MSHFDAVTMITTGFEGQLYGWWTHTLSQLAKTSIIGHTKTVTTNYPTQTRDPSNFESTSTQTQTTTTTSEPDVVMQLCNDLRLKSQLKKQKLTTRKELGSWCEQFGFERLPSHKKRKYKTFKNKLSKKYPYRINRDYKSNKKGETIWSPNKKSRETSRRKNYHRKNNKCFKCGKGGHYANKCPDQKKKINSLDLDDQTKEKIIQALYTDSKTPSSRTSSLDNEVLIINESSSDSETSSSSYNTEPDAQPCFCKEINVLDKYDYSLMISMIDSIEDPIQKGPLH
ncbi:hypothetical protein Ddye_016669 [Dipteronia dyeriana]|uniref:CCHC-type domain-containing protein n=1 Tax=Dipteronia dyeriana TaxID=168575 RepID=A0AAD9U830_9ROSI|nr:hypothetical protein Ddye_016669 [Dipteronia dyeriana]